MLFYWLVFNRTLSIYIPEHFLAVLNKSFLELSDIFGLVFSMNYLLFGTALCPGVEYRSTPVLLKEGKGHGKRSNNPKIENLAFGLIIDQGN